MRGQRRPWMLVRMSMEEQGMTAAWRGRTESIRGQVQGCLLTRRSTQHVKADPYSHGRKCDGRMPNSR